MRPQLEERTVESTGVITSVPFSVSIKDSAHLMNIVRNRMSYG